jgi:hypothetical protein
MEDRKLPGLQPALNDSEMRKRLRLSLWNRFGIDETLHVTAQHQVLKYTPGKRCVVEYQMHFNGSRSSPRRLIGKLYRKDRGRAIFNNLSALWQASTESAKTAKPFWMPEPLAYDAELGMVLQDVVPGRRLTDFSGDSELPHAVDSVAANLAALHSLPMPMRVVGKGLADHLEKYCHPGPPAMMDACPELAPLIQRLVDGIFADSSLQSARRCPVHGDLGLAQIFITGTRAYFIDFDGFCFSHAALDVGNFLVTLRAHFPEKSKELIPAFLEKYYFESASSRLIGLRAYEAFAYLRRATICFRARTEPNWMQPARQLLERGQEVLDSVDMTL